MALIPVCKTPISIPCQPTEGTQAAEIEADLTAHINNGRLTGRVPDAVSAPFGPQASQGVGQQSHNLNLTHETSHISEQGLSLSFLCAADML